MTSTRIAPDAAELRTTSMPPENCQADDRAFKEPPGAGTTSPQVPSSSRWDTPTATRPAAAERTATRTSSEVGPPEASPGEASAVPIAPIAMPAANMSTMFTKHLPNRPIAPMLACPADAGAPAPGSRVSRLR